MLQSAGAVLISVVVIAVYLVLVFVVGIHICRS